MRAGWGGLATPTGKTGALRHEGCSIVDLPLFLTTEINGESERKEIKARDGDEVVSVRADRSRDWAGRL